MGKIIGYARVSTREQSVNSVALEQQVARLIPFVDEVLVDVESGKNDTRKNFRKLEELIKSGNVSQVIVTRLDRLSRRLITLKRFIDLISNHDCTIKALDNNIDTESAAGKFHISLLGALAEMESDQISERVKHGLSHLIKNGKVFKPPFGFAIENYTLIHDNCPYICTLKDKKEWSKYAIALLIVDKYLEKKSLNAVSVFLQENFGILKTSRVISRWFQNPALSGTVYFPSTNQYFYNQHEPLVEQEKLNEVLKIISFNTHSKGFIKTSNYSLSGLLFCSCGSKATIVQQQNYKYIYIKCGLLTFCPCYTKRQKYMKYSDIEKLVFNAISNHAYTLVNCINSAPKESRHLQHLKSELKQLQSIFNPHKSILAAIKELELEITKEEYHSLYISQNEDQKLFIDTFTSPNFWEFFQTEPLEIRQSLLRKFIKKITINPFSVEFYF